MGKSFRRLALNYQILYYTIISRIMLFDKFKCYCNCGIKVAAKQLFQGS